MSESNRAIVESAVRAWEQGDGAAFFRLLADDAKWTLIGTTALSKTYQSRREFIDGALIPLSEKIEGAITPKLVNLICEGDFVVLQWDGTGTMKSGTPYHNRYCWVMRFENGKIQEGTAYLDTELVTELLET